MFVMEVNYNLNLNKSLKFVSIDIQNINEQRKQSTWKHTFLSSFSVLNLLLVQTSWQIQHFVYLTQFYIALSVVLQKSVIVKLPKRTIIKINVKL